MNPCIDDKKMNYILPYNLQWFANDEGGEKTEPATQKKLEDARKEGKVAKSKELTAAFALIVLFLVLKFFVGYVGNGLLEIFSFVLEAHVVTFALVLVAQAVKSVTLSVTQVLILPPVSVTQVLTAVLASDHHPVTFAPISVNQLPIALIKAPQALAT